MHRGSKKVEHISKRQTGILSSAKKKIIIIKFPFSLGFFFGLVSFYLYTLKITFVKRRYGQLRHKAVIRSTHIISIKTFFFKLQPKITSISIT